MKCQTMGYDRRFQSKLVRALYQFPEESKNILENLQPEAFTVATAAWVVRKLKWSWQAMHQPASETVLKCELQRETKQKQLNPEFSQQLKRFLKKIDVPVNDKTYLFDQAHEFCRTASVERFFLKHVEDVTQKGRINWSSFESDLRDQVAFGARCDGDLGINHFENMEDRIARRLQTVDQGIPTGTVLDAYFTGGGLPRKQLGSVAAPTGVGKTAVLTYFGGSALIAGKNVLHITLEVDEPVLADRYDSRFSGISLSSLHKCPKRLRKALKEVSQRYHSNLQIKYWPPSTLTFGMLRTYLKRLEASAFYPDVILLDYADLMSKSEFRHGNDGEKDYAALGEIYVHLRGIAGEFNLPIWTATQTNRQAIGKRNLDHSDIADSYRKAQVCDVLLALSQTEGEASRQTARVQLLKNRNGPRDITHLIQFDASRVMLGEIVKGS